MRRRESAPARLRAIAEELLSIAHAPKWSGGLNDECAADVMRSLYYVTRAARGRGDSILPIKVGFSEDR